MMLAALLPALFSASFALAQDDRDRPSAEFRGKLNATPGNVTGERTYPTPYVLQNLGLSSWAVQDEELTLSLDIQASFDTARFRGEDQEDVRAEIKKKLPPPAPPALALLKAKQVFSLAEGVSGLMPFMRGHGVDAYGLDLWYDNDLSKLDPSAVGLRSMKKYVEKYREFLLAGDATDLSRLTRGGKPVESPKDGTVPLILSHMLLHFLSDDGIEAVVSQSLRKLAPGGQVRFAYLYPTLEQETQALKEARIAPRAEYLRDYYRRATSDWVRAVADRPEIDLYVAFANTSYTRKPGIPKSDAFTGEEMRELIEGNRSSPRRDPVWGIDEAMEQGIALIVFTKKK